MYDTLVDDVKAAIEEKIVGENSVSVKGWAFSTKFGVCPLRCRYDGTLKMVDFMPRTDICDKFNRNNIILCGWKSELPKNKFVDVQIKLGSDWTTFMSFNTTEEEKKESSPKKSLNEYMQESLNQVITDFKAQHPESSLPKVKSTLIDLSINDNRVSNIYIIDNFYKDPNSIRKLAVENVNFMKNDMKLVPSFEKIMGVKLKGFDKYQENGIFNLSVAGDPIIIHTTNSDFGAILFLTPNAPVNSGITLYRSKQTHKMTVSDAEQGAVFRNGQYDTTEFEEIDKIGNVYNRLVIFNTKLIHGISHNFGKDMKNGRLVQTFAFDLDAVSTKISFNM